MATRQAEKANAECLNDHVDALECIPDHVAIERVPGHLLQACILDGYACCRSCQRTNIMAGAKRGLHRPAISTVLKAAEAEIDNRRQVLREPGAFKHGPFWLEPRTRSTVPALLELSENFDVR